MTQRNDTGQRAVMLDEELIEFLHEHCESNMRMGLMTLNGVTTRERAEPFVELIEKFKRVKKALEEAR